jgi:hypothetical protein
MIADGFVLTFLLIFALVCVLIRKQFSRLGCVQNAFELSGSISIALTELAWK